MTVLNFYISNLNYNTANNSEKYNKITNIVSIDSDNNLNDLYDKINLLINKLINKHNKNSKNNKYNFYLKFNNKIVPPNHIKLYHYFKIDRKLKESTIINLDFIIKIKGGSALLEFLSAIFEIGEIFILIINAIEYIVKLFIWLLQLTVWFIVELMNPVKFFQTYINLLEYFQLC